MNLKYTLGLITLFAMSCSKDDDKPAETSRLTASEESIPIDTTDAGAIPTSEDGTLGLTGILEDLLALTPTLTLVGNLASPTVGGVALQASDITVSSPRVYVAYNTAGESFAGGIDVIDISVPATPILTSQSLYSDMDISKVFVNGTSLYAAGASTTLGGAFVSKITLDGSGKITPTIATVALRSSGSASVPAYVGTSVYASGSYVYALSGDNGGLSILNNSDLSQKSFTSISNARDLTSDNAGTSLYVVTGKTGTDEASVKSFNQTTGAVQAAYNVSLPNAVIDSGKSTLLTGTLTQLATAGKGGARLICMSNGSTLGIAPNPALPALTADDQVANAAAFGNGLMYVANGGAGVSIYAVNVPLIQIGCLGITITYLGRFSLGEEASANNVRYVNGHLVVATGAHGFKIIKVTQSLLSTLLMIL